ncbi:MAG: hypothetical protein WBM99_01700, partial [Psychromonas sp.]
RFFDINQYGNWISKQITQSSGYQISFQSIDRDLYNNSRFSVKDVVLFIDQDEVVQIKQLNVEIGAFDLWERELEIELIEIVSANINLDESGLKGLIATEKDKSTADKRALLPWQQLFIKQLRVLDLHAELEHSGDKLRLQQANVSVTDLRVIADNQIQPNLLQGPLTAVIQGIELDLSDLPKIVMSDSQLDLSVDQNTVIIEQLLTHVFDGELTLRAQALLAVDPLVSSVPTINSITIESLLLKDMNLVIPPFANISGSPQTEQKQQPLLLPVETIFIKQARSQNINISSENPHIPLTVDNLNSVIQELYLVKNSQLIELYGDSNQDAIFSLKFGLLRWVDSEVEGFSTSGSLNRENPSLQLLQEHLKTP